MKTKYSLVAGAALALYASTPVWALDIATVPLFQSVTVQPNVMLLIDDSGSMDHIVWADAYNPAVNYLESSGTNKVEFRYNGDWLAASDNPGTAYPWYFSTGTQWTCAAGFSAFRLGESTRKCLKLPNMGNANTRLEMNYVAYLARTYAHNTDLSLGNIVPNKLRIEVAREAATQVVDGNPGMRFGLFSFNNNQGGSLRAAIGSSSADVKQAIANLSSANWTPLAESYYEVTRYFRGLSANYGSTTFTSPIQYRCQKNFSVVMTDGLPTYDTTFPSDDPEAVRLSKALPDWDGLSPAVGLPYSDGNGGDESKENASLYLDDIAKFAYDIDLMQSGNDGAGKSYQDPAFERQNIVTYTVGFTLDNQMLKDAAAYGRGQYYNANNAAQLNQAFQSALQSIRAQTSSAAAIATNSTRLDTNTLIYQARFNSADWSGELIAYRINTNGTVGNVAWRTTGSNIFASPNSRNIVTYSGSSGANFLWASLSSDQQAALRAGGTDADGQARLAWLRGTADGTAGGATLRSRSTILGDIVNSDPLFVGAQNFGYQVPNTLADTAEPADFYPAYLAGKSAAGTRKLLMVGSNGGMVHGFDATTGAELFAYVPNSIYSKRTSGSGQTPGLAALTAANYQHRYYVDGAIGLGDVYTGTSWKTYAVGGLGAGGRGIYALDVTGVQGGNSFSASDVKWEITAPDSGTTGDWADLGFTYGAPVVARTQDNTWVAIFGNGYNSNTGKAVLYVVNALTGTLIKKIDTGVASDNGLSAPAVLVDSNRRVTYVYAGDLKGNLWKFDLNNSNTNQWDSAIKQGSTPKPLFAAGSTKPITARPDVGAHPEGGLVVLFGTGKYLETTDNTVGNNPPLQSFYGIRDNGLTATVPASDLVQQEISITADNYRVVTQNTVNWTQKKGWYLNLKDSPTASATGERVVSTPVLRGGRAIFTTVIPSQDPCLAGGESWLMELDAFTGARLPYAVIDRNNDRAFNAGDKVACGTETCDTSGQKSDQGIIKTPGIISAGETEYKYAGGSSGGIMVVTEKGSTSEGRMSWRQLR